MGARKAAGDEYCQLACDRHMMHRISRFDGDWSGAINGVIGAPQGGGGEACWDNS